MQSMQPIEILRDSPLFHGVTNAAFEEMARVFVPQSWPRHTEIMAGTQTSQRFVILTAGRVKITRSNGHNGRELILWLLGPGDGFDVIALLDGEPHAVSAHTLDEVHGFSAPMAQVRAWIAEDAKFRLAAHRYAAAQLRELSELATDLALHDTATRLARLLLRYLGGSDTHPSQACLIDDLPHDELAAMIGSVRIVVNRLLSHLRRESIVRSKGGRLRVLDLQRLSEEAALLKQTA